MAYEIVNNGQVTPHRLHALVRLVARLQSPTRNDLFSLLQPTDLVSKPDAADEVLRAARELRLVEEQSDGPRAVRLLLDGATVEQIEMFRTHLQSIMLGVADEDRPNFLLNLFAAWYAVQNERVFRFGPDEYHTRFNRELFPDVEERQFNRTKLVAWNSWAYFLGLCWPLKIGSRREVLVPNCHVRLRTCLHTLASELAQEDGQSIPFGSFLRRLADSCPELDGGVLFERCWQASRGTEQRGTQVSLMLSNALRQLHDAGSLQLVRQPDAAENWYLYRAEGHPVNQVTHIELRPSKGVS